MDGLYNAWIVGWFAASECITDASILSTDINHYRNVTHCRLATVTARVKASFFAPLLTAISFLQLQLPLSDRWHLVTTRLRSVRRSLLIDLKIAIVELLGDVEKWLHNTRSEVSSFRREISSLTETIVRSYDDFFIPLLLCLMSANRITVF